jgi:AhpD family alkylhydroperoxidase
LIIQEFNKSRKIIMDKMKEKDQFFKDFGKLDDRAFSDGFIPKKYKELTMISISIVTKCKECISYHIQESINRNSSPSEIIDAIKMGMMAGGSTTYPYVRHAFNTLIELKVLE